MDKIDKLRLKLYELLDKKHKTQEDKDELLRISREIDLLVLEYYKGDGIYDDSDKVSNEK